MVGSDEASRWEDILSYPVRSDVDFNFEPLFIAKRACYFLFSFIFIIIRHFHSSLIFISHNTHVYILTIIIIKK